MASTISPGGSYLTMPETIAPQLGMAIETGVDFFALLVDALPAAVYTTDSAGRITYYNEAAVQLWGHRPELGRSEWCGSWRLFWPDGRAMSHDECPMAIAVKERRAVRGVEAVAERPDGTRVPFIPFPTPIYDLQGEFIGAVNLLVDITDRKRDEAAAQRLAAIVESSDDAIVSKNLDGIITTWNKGAERIFEYAAEDIVGLNIRTLIPPEHQKEEDMIIERVKRGQRVEHYETVRRRKDGTLIDVSLTVSPIKDKSGRVIGASKIVRDIVARKKAEAQLALLASEAEHRTKNILGTVQAAVRLTRATTVDEFRHTLSGRIRALANVNSLVVASQWTGAPLRGLVEQELAPYSQGENERTRIIGPAIVLEPRAAHSMAVALHELATNASKYGALSTQEGHVHVEWSRAGSHLVIRWLEQDGPPVRVPMHRGFGATVIEAATKGCHDGAVHFDWRATGLLCEIVMDYAHSVVP